MSLRDSAIGTASALRYAFSGVANTAAGYAVIFVAMWVGIDPYLSNALGYAFGVIMAFVMTKLFVFGKRGQLAGQALRYSAAFCVCYALNLLALHLTVTLGTGAIIGQIAGGAVYALAMYLIAGRWVFAGKKSPTGESS